MLSVDNDTLSLILHICISGDFSVSSFLCYQTFTCISNYFCAKICILSHIVVSFCQSDWSISIQWRVHVIPHTKPGSASQFKVKHPRHGRDAVSTQSAVFSYRGTNESVFCSVVGSSSNSEAMSFPWATATNLYLILSPRARLLVRLPSTYRGCESQGHLRRSSRAKRQEKDSRCVLCTLKLMQKLTTGGGSALSPLYPGFSCKKNKENMNMNNCSSSVEPEQKNKTGKKQQLNLGCKKLSFLSYSLNRLFLLYVFIHLKAIHSILFHSILRSSEKWWAQATTLTRQQ